VIAREYGRGSSSVQRFSSITWPVLQRKYQMLIGTGAAVNRAGVLIVPPRHARSRLVATRAVPLRSRRVVLPGPAMKPHLPSCAVASPALVGCSTRRVKRARRSRPANVLRMLHGIMELIPGTLSLSRAGLDGYHTQISSHEHQLEDEQERDDVRFEDARPALHKRYPYTLHGHGSGG